MKAGQRVRIRQASPICKTGRLSPEAVGTVLCSYTLVSRPGTPERVDVRFTETTIMWGVAANEFEAIEESRQMA